MKFSHRSYMQPTPKNLRKLGDGFLGIMATIVAASIAKDAEVISYIALGFGVIGKFLTDFFAE